MTSRRKFRIGLISSFVVGFAATVVTALASLDSAGSATDPQPQPPLTAGPLTLSLDFTNGQHLAVLTVVAFFTFFLVTLCYIVPNIIRLKRQEKALKGLRTQVDNIEESVCSMGGLSKRLTEIERRTLEISKMLSKIESKLNGSTFSKAQRLSQRQS